MGRKKSSFTLTVLSEESVLYYGDAERLFVPYQKTTIAVLPQHTPMIMKLSTGPVAYVLKGQNVTVCHITSGLLHVQENEVMLVANGTEHKATKPS